MEIERRLKEEEELRSAVYQQEMDLPVRLSIDNPMLRQQSQRSASSPRDTPTSRYVICISNGKCKAIDGLLLHVILGDCHIVCQSAL